MHKDWKIIETPEMVMDAIEMSYEKIIILYKHSTTCGICLTAMDELARNFDEIKNDVIFYYLDLLTFRALSNFIATHLEVIHQSPQILLLKEGKVIYTATHMAIKVAKIKEKIVENNLKE